MASGAGNNLLAKERESILSSALEAMTPGDVEGAESLGVDPRQLLVALLDFIDVRDEGAASDDVGLNKAAHHLSDHEIPWKTTAGLCQALINSIYAHLNGMSEKEEMSRLSGSLLQAQARLFELYLEAEGNKRERLAQHLREVDRFPDTIAATLDPPTLTKVGLGRLKNLVRMDEATIFSIDAQRRLVPVAGDLANENVNLPALALQGSAAFALLELGDPYWEGPENEGSCFRAFREDKGANAVLVLPMVVRGRTTAVMLLSDGPDRKRFTCEEIELAGRFASRLAVALENAYLHAREQHKIKETVALLEITRAINSTLDLQEILEKVVQMTVDLCGVVMCVIYLKEDEEGQFIPAAHYGFIEDGQWEGERKAGFLLGELQQTQIRTLEEGVPLVLPCAEAGCLLPAELMYEHGVDLIFVFPLSSRQELTGVFTLFYPCREADDLEREEIEVVSAIAAQASMAIENAALYEDIERSYFSTVKALAKAIEVKDPYTHGHSERVTEYALLIADAMRLEERDRQKLKYAATLHDIGKIGIAGRVLNKPGNLTDEEYSHVKTHPMLGDSIIEPVDFLQGPRPIILHHHERFDGTGYPLGLKGSGIPLCARILSVADAFEAMRSDRPYRRALPLGMATEELIRNAGNQFDPEVVEVFLAILERFGGDPVNR